MDETIQPISIAKDNEKKSYANPLLKNLQMNELTEVNFHVFQKDISKILLHLMAYTNGV